MYQRKSAALVSLALKTTIVCTSAQIPERTQTFKADQEFQYFENLLPCNYQVGHYR